MLRVHVLGLEHRRSLGHRGNGDREQGLTVIGTKGIVAS